jgi:hypothetical protein
MKTKIFVPVFLSVIVFMGISGLCSGCDNILGVPGDGKVTKETRVVSPFDSIEVSGAFKVYLKQGSLEEVVIEADENLQPLIRAEVRGNTLVIETRKPFSNPTSLNVYITLKDLRKAELSGAVDIFTDGRLNLNEFSLHTSGASNAKMDITVKKLDLDCSGASKLKLTGSATDVSADLSGACDIFAFDLLAENFTLDLSGAGKAQINVSKKISAEISGAGNVRYKGSPTIINQSVSGAGSIKHED